ncbi:uncharacterized protein IUM83_08599 [Phytophthora cinnamomi]|uniref:uncharacterized protein n=1 Tax=Phytophthora cinnamomi TaxID=4785 RepID=UPI0035598ABA|nr:hypothetical protein IUM83_08599 [Phytophthora cinnamomi]
MLPLRAGGDGDDHYLGGPSTRTVEGFKNKSNRSSDSIGIVVVGAVELGAVTNKAAEGDLEHVDLTGQFVAASTLGVGLVAYISDNLATAGKRNGDAYKDT